MLRAPCIRATLIAPRFDRGETSGLGNCGETLHVGDGIPIQECEPGKSYLIVTAAALCCQRHVEGERARSVGGGAGDDDNRTGLGGKAEISESDLTGTGLIEEVQDVLFDRAGAHQVERAAVGEFNDFGDALTDLGSCVRLPGLEFGVELFGESVHGANPLSEYSSEG